MAYKIVIFLWLSNSLSVSFSFPPSLHFQKKKMHYFKTQSIESQMNLQLVGFQAKY